MISKLKHAPKELQANSAYVLEVVASHGSSLKYTTSQLQNDPNIVGTACSQNGRALKYASVDMKNSKSIVTIAVNKCPHALEFASNDLKNDQNIVLLAVQADGQCLVHSSVEMKNNKEIVLAAVKTYHGAFQLASEKVKNDYNVVVAAVRCHWSVLRHVSAKYQANPQVVLLGVKQHRDALQFAGLNLLYMRRFIKKAVKYHWGALQYASDELKDDDEIVWSALEQHGGALMYASDRIKSDRKMVIKALSSYWGAFHYMDSKFKTDKEIVQMTVRQNITILYMLPHSSMEGINERELLIEATKLSPSARLNIGISPSLRNDVEIGMIVLSHNPPPAVKEGIPIDDVRKYMQRILNSYYHTPYTSFFLVLCASSRVLIAKETNRTKQHQPLHPTAKNVLQMLNKMNRWSSLEVKRNIAEYSGVQCVELNGRGDEWHYLSKAAKVLDFCLEENNTCMYINTPASGSSLKGEPKPESSVTIDDNDDTSRDTTSSPVSVSQSISRTQLSLVGQRTAILEEEIDPNFEPTETEIEEYARFIGMDIVVDKEFFWIAREGLKAPLPPQWKPCKTTSDTAYDTGGGEIYYFNFTTGESTWEHPCDGHYRNMYEENKRKSTQS